MALNIDDELNLPLSEFVKLPTTVDFQVLNTERFKATPHRKLCAENVTAW